MHNQPNSQPGKKLTLKKESISLLNALSTRLQGPTAIDCSVTC